ncbi:MAG: hypothetical protein CVU56_08265 [Deltaproteobacteria bacterium HGW-Deltaproteobacteria-14]|jgi:pSer/pThr/pTyr-binding forkhead associated (FHA) protein|nr:MAG: hypothetical protein CVU56_08265 [Deltaproteobacteria bacterium HGW-Deltaproteobacteria-14]
MRWRPFTWLRRRSRAEAKAPVGVVAWLALSVPGAVDPCARFAVRAGVTTMGALSSSTIVLTQAGVSKRQADLRVDADGAEVVDLGSTGGTSVNGARVTRRRLRDGDVIAFGVVRLRFEVIPGRHPALHRRRP